MAKKPDSPKADELVKVTLDRAVALVLFEFLSRNAEEDDAELLGAALESEAELPAMFSLLTELEEVLTEPFADEYRSLLEAARNDVIRRFGKA
jgi:hypothetical protein